MNNKNKTWNTSSELQSKIESWLSKQGFPLEMRVAKKFLEKGYGVQHSEYFYDKTGDKYREIDLVCERNIGNIQASINFEICFTVECKLSSNKPWLLLTIPYSRTVEHVDGYAKKTIITYKKTTNYLQILIK